MHNNKICHLPKFFKRAGLTSCFVSLFIAVMGLLGYIPGMHLLSSVSSSYVPMAPSTALSFIFLSVIMILYIYRPVVNFVRFGSMLVVVTVSVFGFLKCVEYFAGIEASFEQVLVPISDKLGEVPIGIMSPLTGCGFLIAGISVLLYIYKYGLRNENKWLWVLPGSLGTLQIAGSLIVLLGYLYKQPFMYGESSIVPMALTTAIAFFFLGIGILSINGSKQFPVCMFVGDDLRPRLLRIFVPLVALGLVIMETLHSTLFTIKAGINSATYLSAVTILSIGIAIIAVFWVSLFIAKRADLLEKEVKDLAKFPSENPNPVLRIASNGKVLYSNDSGKKVLRFWSTDLNEEAPEKWKKVIDEVFKTGKSLLEEEVVEGRLLSFSAVLVKDAGYVNLYSRDITEQRNIEKLIVSARKDWESTFDAMADMVTIHDLDFNILRANKAVATMLGCSVQEIVGKKCYELYHGSQNAPDSCVSCGISNNEKATEIEYFHPNLNRYLNIKAFPRFDEKNNLIGVVHVARDITERKKSEKALIESEDRFDHVLQSSGDAILLIDNNMFVDCNKVTVWMLGYDNREEFLRVHPSKLSPENQPDGMKSSEKADEMMKIAMDQGFHRFLWMHKKKDGKSFPVEVSLTPIVYKGRVVLHCLWRDLTEKNKIEEEKKNLQGQLIQSQKMEAIGTMASGIAHNFNNILASIRGRSDMAINTVLPESKTYAYLENINKSVESARQLTDQMMGYCRKQEQAITAMDISATIKESVNMFRPSVKEAIEIHENINDDCGFVLADSNNLQQIILNMLINSYSSIGNLKGSIDVSLSRIIVDADLRGKYVNLTKDEYVKLGISDTGCGMNNETKKRIFEPFFTTKEVGKGTGLGLSMVHGVTKEYGGEIIVESELGKGTEICIYFPIVDKA